ncbi:hypothetical protein NKI14_34695, partial [Mesorhizobium sp. M0767]
MIAPGNDLKIYVATRPVDFRRGMDGLALVSMPAQYSPEVPFESSPVSRGRRSSGARPGRPAARNR